ncbi:MAG TPA: hypothetical protein VMI75_27050 [Polyangiaceae bacterium]|nr:hypothetical protein [Polyangiaceae bacterium]
MKGKLFVGVAIGALVAAALACSSSSGGGASANCLVSYAGQGCLTCVQTNCNSQLGAASNSCGSFISCVCPNGTYVASDLQMCESRASSQCQSDGSALNTCVQQKCSTACSGDGG